MKKILIAVLVLTVCLAGYYTWSVADGYTSGGATVTDAVETIDIRWTSGSVTVGYHDADTVILEEEAVRLKGTTACAGSWTEKPWSSNTIPPVSLTS